MRVPTEGDLEAQPYSPTVAPRTERSRTDAGRPSVSTLFDERLTVSWWAWPVAIAIAAFLAAELAIGAFYLRTWVTFATAAVLVVAALIWLGRIRIRVQAAADGHPDGGVLRVDDATLPVHAVSAVVVLDAAERRELLGTGADPLGFVIQRPWVPGGVRIDLDDPTDPTPYWFVSTRHPQALVAALHRAGLPEGPTA